MKLLMITQKVDINDDVLGVYHEWIKKISKKVDKLNVICLFKGEINLPDNVRVYSLGKEKGEGSKLVYVLRFYKLLWKLRGEYKDVFVHMNEEYILLAGWIWKILGKKIVFWRNHPRGNFITKIVFSLSNIILATSRESFAYKNSKKTKLMPVGIDVDRFSKISRIKKEKELEILYVGRISPIKNIDKIIESVVLLSKHNIPFRLYIAGSVGNNKDEKYFIKIKDLISKNNIEKEAIFLGSVANKDIDEVYKNSDILINLTETGSMDKAIFEAMASKRMVITSNNSMNPDLSDNLKNYVFCEQNSESVFSTLRRFYDLSDKEINNITSNLFDYVREEHDINILIDRLVSVVR